jgi:hypothetical protein
LWTNKTFRTGEGSYGQDKVELAIYYKRIGKEEKGQEKEKRLRERQKKTEENEELKVKQPTTYPYSI